MIGWQVFTAGRDHPDPVLVAVSVTVILLYVIILIVMWRGRR